MEDIETKNSEKSNGNVKELEVENAALQTRVQELETLYALALPELKSLRHRVNNGGKGHDEAGGGEMGAVHANTEEMEEELDYLRRQGNGQSPLTSPLLI